MNLKFCKTFEATKIYPPKYQAMTSETFLVDGKMLVRVKRTEFPKMFQVHILEWVNPLIKDQTRWAFFTTVKGKSNTCKSGMRAVLKEIPSLDGQPIEEDNERS